MALSRGTQVVRVHVVRSLACRRTAGFSARPLDNTHATRAHSTHVYLQMKPPRLEELTHICRMLSSSHTHYECNAVACLRKKLTAAFMIVLGYPPVFFF